MHHTTAFFGFLFVMCVIGCSNERATIPDASGADKATSPTTYLALGDSYTICEGVAAEDRWPVVLAARLGWAEPTIVARTGWTVAELEAGIEEQLSDDATYDEVTLLIGVNDEFRGGDVAQYRVDFERVLRRAILFAGGDAAHVRVVSIPDYGVTPFGASRGSGISDRIDAYNATAEEISGELSVQFVNITPISRAQPDAVNSDGLHPNAAQYKDWVDAIAPTY